MWYFWCTDCRLPAINRVICAFANVALPFSNVCEMLRKAPTVRTIPDVNMITCGEKNQTEKICWRQSVICASPKFLRDNN